MNVITVVMFFGGVTLIYSAIKDVSPADVIKSALKGKVPGDTSGDPNRKGGVIDLQTQNLGKKKNQSAKPTTPNGPAPNGTGQFDDWQDFFGPDGGSYNGGGGDYQHPGYQP